MLHQPVGVPFRTEGFIHPDAGEVLSSHLSADGSLLELLWLKRLICLRFCLLPRAIHRKSLGDAGV